jgi:hypothetical protein
MSAIDSMTVGEVRALLAMFGTAAQQPAAHPMVGRHVILRCVAAGVHAGVLISQTGDVAVLRDARRLWSWKTNGGIALSGLAVHGLASGKVDTKLAEIALTGVIETIPTSRLAQESIDAA